jgi:hypothetical protein
LSSPPPPVVVPIEPDSGKSASKTPKSTKSTKNTKRPKTKNTETVQSILARLKEHAQPSLVTAEVFQLATQLAQKSDKFAASTNQVLFLLYIACHACFVPIQEKPFLQSFQGQCLGSSGPSQQKKLLGTAWKRVVENLRQADALPTLDFFKLSCHFLSNVLCANPEHLLVAQCDDKPRASREIERLVLCYLAFLDTKTAYYKDAAANEKEKLKKKTEIKCSKHSNRIWVFPVVFGLMAVQRVSHELYRQIDMEDKGRVWGDDMITCCNRPICDREKKKFSSKYMPVSVLTAVTQDMAALLPAAPAGAANALGLPAPKKHQYNSNSRPALVAASDDSADEDDDDDDDDDNDEVLL